MAIRRTESAPQVADARLASIDALRGFDMFWITGGTTLFVAMSTFMDSRISQVVRVQLDHSVWHGFTFYDLIFPLFVFLSGLSIPFSVTKRLERGEDKATLYRHVAMRTGVLFLIGVLHNGVAFDPFSFRLPGVLQRIALCSGAASLIALNTKVRTQAYITGALLLGYWALVAVVPSPSVDAGVYSPHGNLAGYLDRLFLPFPSRWCCYGFGDSEGILTTIPAVATALLGTLAGHRLRAAGRSLHLVWWLVLAGAACLALGAGWSVVFPINKNLWTSSYVLVAGGWSLLLMALFHWIIDLKEWVAWAFFFQVIGSNAIVMYLSVGVLRFHFLERVLGASAGVSLMVACLDLLARWLLVYVFYRKHWFLRA